MDKKITLYRSKMKPWFLFLNNYKTRQPGPGFMRIKPLRSRWTVHFGSMCVHIYIDWHSGAHHSLQTDVRGLVLVVDASTGTSSGLRAVCGIITSPVITLCSPVNVWWQHPSTVHSMCGTATHYQCTRVSSATRETYDLGNVRTAQPRNTASWLTPRMHHSDAKQCYWDNIAC